LVAFARVPELRRDLTDMEHLLRESVRRFRETEEGSKQRIELMAEPGHALVDGGRLRQVVSNLLVNAASFSKANQVIEVRGRPWNGGGYEIAVSDRGPGVAKGDRHKIFEPFFTKRAGGSGLGLSVCMGIVRAHGGVIEVSDNPAGGATLRVRIPGQGRGIEKVAS
jgi:signal transduction histidine kinase